MSCRFGKISALQAESSGNFGGGHHNHSLFWTIMAPAGKGGGGEPIGALADALKHRRADYVAAWWNVVNWPEVAKRYEAARK